VPQIRLTIYPHYGEILLIAQEAPLVEHFVRKIWSVAYSAADGLEATVELLARCSLALADIYELVTGGSGEYSPPAPSTAVRGAGGEVLPSLRHPHPFSPLLVSSLNRLTAPTLGCTL